MGIVRYRDMLVAVMSSELEMMEGTLQVHVGRRYLRVGTGAAEIWRSS